MNYYFGDIFSLLPPAYVVRGKVMFWQASVHPSIHPSMILSVHRGGVPISHNALQHFPECHGAATGGGYPGGVPWQGQYPGGYPARGYPVGGILLGGNLLGGTLPGVPSWGGTLPGGIQVRYLPWPGQDGGGTQLGQHREYLLHGGRYASCVHAGGLSCFHILQNKDYLH